MKYVGKLISVFMDVNETIEINPSASSTTALFN